MRRGVAQTWHDAGGPAGVGGWVSKSAAATAVVPCSNPR